jgi:alpha-aminoadipic semialdehyde synthase
MVDQAQSTIAILRECKNKWERRCSLTPQEVKVITAAGIRVLVQPSTSRCYSEDDFEAAGAIIQEDVSGAQVIFGVKEVPIENLLPNKTYFFFSHTIKAQSYNMPLLDKLLELKIRMVDFETIREAAKEGCQPQRLVAFGRYAGIAGAFETPFVYLGSSYMYEDFEAMSDALGRVGKNISISGLPKALSPIVFGVTGTGRCAQGSMEVLEQLPHIKVAPKELRAYLADTSKHNNKQIVISQFTSADIAVPIDGKPFDKQRYYSEP